MDPHKIFPSATTVVVITTEMSTHYRKNHGISSNQQINSGNSNQESGNNGNNVQQ